MNIISQALGYLTSLWVKIEKIQSPQLLSEQLDHQVPVVYILENTSASDFAVLKKQCKLQDLPAPITQTIDGIDIKNGVISLTSNRWFNNNNNNISPTLEKLSKSLHDVQLVPVSIYWGRRPGQQKSFLKAAFSDSWEKAGAVNKFFKVLLNGRNTFVEISQPLSLRALQDTTDDQSLSNRKLHRVLRVHFRLVRTAVLGPELSHRRLLINEIIHSSQVKKAGSAFAKSRKITPQRAHKTARKYAEEIAANISYPTLRILDVFLTWLWNKIYKGVNVNHIESVKEAAKDHTLIYVPCHRSHIDYLLMSYTLYYNGLNIPHIAAGVNLNMPVVGPILRRAGAFFMRRSFKGDKLYAAVFNEYMDAMIKKGYPMEYYVEGGRSRTGRSLDAKAGMLNMTVKSYLNHSDRPIAFVPVYIGYEKIFEGNSYLNELRGKDKKGESLFGLLKIIKRLKNYGQVNVNFGELIKLDPLLDQHAPKWRQAEYSNDHKPEWFAGLIDQLAGDIMTGINSAAAANPVNLVAMLLLSSDKQAMDCEEAKYQLQTIVDMQKALPYTNKITLPEGSASDWLNYCKGLNLVDIKRQKLGNVYQLNNDWVTLSTYYRNNILHMFALPSLITCMFHESQRIKQNTLIKTIELLYPFIQNELHLHWQGDNISEHTEKWIEHFITSGLLSTDVDGYLINADENTREFDTLRILAHVMMPTLERYYITVSMLQKFGSGQLSAGELEKFSHQMAERLSLLNGLNAPEFFDRALFKKFIFGLRRSQLLTTNDNNKLEFGEAIESLADMADNILRRSVRLTIKQTARKS